MRIRFALVVLAAVLCVSSAAAQLRGKVPGAVDEIAHVNANMEMYRDRATVEGEVTSTRGKDLFQIEDQTGSIYILIPWSLQHETGVPKLNDRIRVYGKAGQEPVHKHMRGLRAHAFEIVETAN
jgi:uncharacterized protein YdeI (BOF family)